MVDLKESFEKKREQQKLYHLNHKACPECWNTNTRQTYMGFVFESIETFKDENEAVCNDCGWTGIVHDLIIEPGPHTKLIWKSRITRLQTGGAPGADETWVTAAENYGVESLIISFKGHRDQYKNGIRFAFPPVLAEVEDLTEHQMGQAIHHMREANVRLKRGIARLKPYTERLLCRNWYVTLDVDMTVAIASVFNPQTQIAGGGTGWGVEFSRMQGIKTFVFCQSSKSWWWLTDEGPAIALAQRPILSGVVAAIGARNLTTFGSCEIFACINNSLAIANKAATNGDTRHEP